MLLFELIPTSVPCAIYSKYRNFELGAIPLLEMNHHEGEIWILTYTTNIDVSVPFPVQFLFVQFKIFPLLFPILPSSYLIKNEKNKNTSPPVSIIVHVHWTWLCYLSKKNTSSALYAEETTSYAPHAFYRRKRRDPRSTLHLHRRIHSILPTSCKSADHHAHLLSSRA